MGTRRGNRRSGSRGRLERRPVHRFGRRPRRWLDRRQGRDELRFDLGDLGLHAGATTLGDLRRDAGIRIDGALKRRERLSVDALAEAALVGIAILERASDRFLDCVQ
ncbi:MAG: hypothetical protein KF723_15210 [Rhizobiaceae bacterium]|nr:hypothetical protein [Rhizobiaceae bacterium]